MTVLIIATLAVLLTVFAFFSWGKSFAQKKMAKKNLRGLIVEHKRINKIYSKHSVNRPFSKLRKKG